MPKKVRKTKKLKKTNKTSKSKKTAKVKKQKKETIIGKVEHYFDKINVVTTTLKNPLKIGGIIHVKGHTTDFIQPIGSIQIDHESVQKAKKGDGIGIRINQLVRDHDVIYLANKKTISEFSLHANLQTGTADRQDNKINVIQSQPKIPAKPIELPKNNTPKFLSF